MLVMDAMVLIHLSKLSLLENVCDYFRDVAIPILVYKEAVVKGKESNYEDAFLIDEVIDRGKIDVKEVKEEKLIDRADKFNIQSGEAHAVALYRQDNADYLATDDDNVRKKKIILDLNLIGTPVIILKLYRERRISKEKFKASLKKLREIGWFSTMIIDKILEEGEKYG